MTERRRIPVDDEVIPTRRQSPPAAADPAAEPECDCPRLDAADWHEVESDWSDITFVKATTNAVLGVPVGYDTTRAEVQRKATDIGATIPEDAMLLMGEGRFRRPVLLEVEGVAPGAKGVECPGGIVYTRLLPAPWGAIRKLVDETTAKAREKYGRAPDDVWLWYLTCNTCSRARNFETLVVAHYRQARRA